MKTIRILLIAAVLLSANTALGQRIVTDNWQKMEMVFDLPSPSLSTTDVDGKTFTNIVIEGLIPSSDEGAPCLPLFSRLIEVPQCNGFEVRVSDAEYDTITIKGGQLMPAQPSRSKSDTMSHPLVINNKLYATNAFYGLETASVESVGIARDRHLARLQFSPVTYNPATGKLAICRHAVVEVLYRNADKEASLSLFNRYYSPLFASNAMVMNSLYPKSVSTSAPIRYLIVAHSSFNGQLDSFVQWKRRKGFITDIVYTGSSAVGSTTTSIAAYIQSQYTNATADNPAPTYLLIVGDHEQVPAFTGTTDNDHITDLYYISWTSGDNIPDCYCGRFSAQNGDQLAPQIQKTLMYEQYTFADPSFLDRAVLVAGVDGGSAGDFGYSHADPAMDYAAINYINSTRGFTQVMYFKNAYNNPPAASGVTVGNCASSNSATVRNYYNQGAGWINYSAHGSATSWGTPNFTTSHVSSMTNSQKFGLMIGNCCLTNKFEVTTCLGESLLRKDNYCGAVGYIGGSNSTYWYEDFYWAVGLRSSINASMSMAYNSSNLGAYDRLCHTHNEAYSQWAMSQGSIMMVGNMAVQSSTSSRKLYYWEIYHLMGDPSVMPYLTQASTMTVIAPSVITTESNTLTVNAAPHAYLALTSNNGQTLIASAFADANGNATLAISGPLAPGLYELAASAQQYQTSFSQINVVQRSGRMPMVLDITPSAGLTAGSTQLVDCIISNIGDTTAYNITFTFTPSDADALVFQQIGNVETQQIVIDSLAAGDTVTLSCQLHVSEYLADGSHITVTSSATCTDMTLPLTNIKEFSIIAPTVDIDMTQSDDSATPGGNATIVAVVSNNGHAPLVADRLTLTSSTQLIHIGSSNSETSAAFTLEPGASASFSFELHADNLLPTGIAVPLTISHSRVEIESTQFNLFIGSNPYETFEGNTFHTTGWTQSSKPWAVTNDVAYGGSYSLRSSPTMTHSETSDITATVTISTGDSLVFYYKVSSEANYDKFYFYIDNNTKITTSGDVDWTRAAYYVPAGTHTLKFSYSKDGSVNSGSDCAWIDNISLPHQVKPASFETINLCIGDSYTIYGTEISTAEPVDSSIVFQPANDSVHIIDYHVHPTYNTEQDLVVCDSITLFDQMYTVSSEISHLFESVQGCDSLAFYHLTINHSVAESIYDTTYTESYQWNDSTYNESGTYTQTFSTFEGCDSIVTLMLTILDTNNAAIPQDLSTANSQLSIYPNPTSGMILFNRPVNEVTIYDATGRNVMRTTLESKKSLDISNLPDGMYMLFVVEGTKTTTHRIVKRR